MSFGESLPVHDAIHGAVYDENRTAYLLFTRSRPTAMNSTPRAMAQSEDDDLFCVTGVVSTPSEETVLTLQASDRTSFPIRISSTLELFPNALLKFITLVSIEAVMPPPFQGHIPDDYWQHLSDKNVDEAWLKLKGKYLKEESMPDDDPYESFPDEWLTPKTTDYPYCAFVSKGLLLLAFFVREMETKSEIHEFAMVVDPQNRVYLLTRFEVSGFISKDVVIEVAREDGNRMSLKIPLSQIYPEHRERFPKFLAQECVRSIGIRKFVSYPEGLFQQAKFLTAGWI